MWLSLLPLMLPCQPRPFSSSSLTWMLGSEPITSSWCSKRFINYAVFPAPQAIFSKVKLRLYRLYFYAVCALSVHTPGHTCKSQSSVLRFSSILLHHIALRRSLWTENSSFLARPGDQPVFRICLSLSPVCAVTDKHLHARHFFMGAGDLSRANTHGHRAISLSPL